MAGQTGPGLCCSQGVSWRGQADFSGSEPCPQVLVVGVSVWVDEKARTEKNEVFCRASATGKERVGSVMTARQRKCCRCPRPSEVDSDGRGEELLFLRLWQVGIFLVLEGIIFNYDLMCATLQVLCTPPRHTTPMGLPSFPDAAEGKTKQNKTIETNQRKRDQVRLYREAS